MRHAGAGITGNIIGIEQQLVNSLGESSVKPGLAMKILSLCVLVFCSLCDSFQDKDFHWCYEGGCGPKYWPLYYKVTRELHSTNTTLEIAFRTVVAVVSHQLILTLKPHFT